MSIGVSIAGVLPHASNLHSKAGFTRFARFPRLRSPGKDTVPCNLEQNLQDEHDGQDEQDEAQDSQIVRILLILPLILKIVKIVKILLQRGY